MNNHMHKAKIRDNDEFYTKYEDIEAELVHYKDQLKNKIIYCNCDTLESNFYKYFRNNFNSLGLKELIISGLDSNGNGSFNSEENIEKAKYADIIITNPPFSLMCNSYIPMLLELEKKFLIVCQLPLLCTKHIFPQLVEQKFFTGYNSIKKFICKDGSERSFGNALWLTNLKIHKYKQIKLNGQNKKFYRMLNIDAIDVPNIKDIPVNYDGLMLVPLTFLEYLGDSRFELIGSCNYNGKYGRNDIGIDSIGQEWIDRYFASGRKGHYTKNMNIPVYFNAKGEAKCPFSRVVIKYVNQKSMGNA